MSHDHILVGVFVNLRPLRLADAAMTFGWRSAPRARLLNASAISIEQQAHWISSRPESEFNFIIELKNGTAVGMLSLVAIDSTNRHAETGRFLIGDQEAVKGMPVAVESMKLLYEFAFGLLKLNRIYGSVAANNTMMIKWQKYLGMKEEGRMRSHYFINGVWQDAVFLGLLASEASEISIPRMNALINSA